MTSQSAQNVTVTPARAGPSQNWRPSTNMFPDAGTTRSNSTAPGVTSGSCGSGTGSGSGGAAVAGMEAKAGGSRNGSALRSSSGTGANRSAGEAMSRER
jgi:hypothetical protein